MKYGMTYGVDAIIDRKCQHVIWMRDLIESSGV